MRIWIENLEGAKKEVSKMEIKSKYPLSVVLETESPSLWIDTGISSLCLALLEFDFFFFLHFSPHFLSLKTPLTLSLSTKCSLHFSLHINAVINIDRTWWMPTLTPGDRNRSSPLNQSAVSLHVAWDNWLRERFRQRKKVKPFLLQLLAFSSPIPTASASEERGAFQSK